MITFDQFQTNYQRIQSQIASLNPTHQVSLLPVTKNHGTWAIEYCQQVGLKIIGENRVQEALEKIKDFPHIQCELIGHLQTNKVNLALKHFSRIQTVDSERLLTKINEQAKNFKVLLQVNAGNDPAKYGLTIDETPPLLEFALKHCPNVQIEGLMTIPPLDVNLTVAKQSFERLRNLRDALEKEFGIQLPELSMGMSFDFEAAIQEGSTIVRIGSALFGQR